MTSPLTDDLPERLPIGVTAPAVVGAISELDPLGLVSAVQSYDGLVWQASSSIDGRTDWTNTQDGFDAPCSSAGPLTTNRGGPRTVLFRSAHMHS